MKKGRPIIQGSQSGRSRKPITPEEAKVKLETLCARAEHSVGELAEKLRRWGISSSDTERIISDLKKNRFVDDQRFTEAYVRDKVLFARWGKRKIAQSLYLKRIDRETIEEALANIDKETYTENLKHIIQAKIKSTPSLLESYEGRTKIFRFAVSRGYEPALAASVLKEIITGR